MSNWNDDLNDMPCDVLLLVDQETTGICLRKKTEDGDFYDENEIYDDSGLEIESWCYIPA